jgi:TPR repeat protein
MRNAIKAAIVALALAIAAPVAAQDYNTGMEAYDRNDYVAALSEFRPLAERGAAARNQLAYMYNHGYGVPQSYAEAEKWRRLAAEQGDAEAQSSLGNMLRNGIGVQQDDVEAVKWFSMAAEQGDSYAQINLGLHYFEGRGVPQDYILSHMWSNIAASQGDFSAAHLRKLVENKLTKEQIVEAQKLAREWKPE